MLCLINLFVVIYTYFTSDSLVEQAANSSSQLVSVLISTVYYIFGFFVTYRSYHTSLFVVNWDSLWWQEIFFCSILVCLARVCFVSSDVSCGYCHPDWYCCNNILHGLRQRYSCWYYVHHNLSDSWITPSKRVVVVIAPSFEHGNPLCLDHRSSICFRLLQSSEGY